MPLNVELLERLVSTPGIASREDQVRAVAARELRPLVDDLSVDALGNLYATRRATPGGAAVKRLAIAAHLDEIGFLIRHIDDKGFIRLQRVGGFDPRVLVAQRVHIHTRSGEVVPGVLQPASKPIHLQVAGDAKDLKLEDMFVDVGMPVERVRELVAIADMVTLDRPLATVGDTVVSKALDDRLGVYVMIEALRKASPTTMEVVAIATTQEEIGLRGATTAAFAVEADVAIALDVTIAGDIPGGSPDQQISALGGGTAIKVFDSSQVAHPHVVAHLRELAETRGIPYQLEILPAGGTDAAAFQTARGGTATGTISIPTRYVHTVNEMASVADIQASVDLLAAFIDDAASRNYGYELSSD